MVPVLHEEDVGLVEDADLDGWEEVGVATALAVATKREQWLHKSLQLVNWLVFYFASTHPSAFMVLRSPSGDAMMMSDL